MELLNVFLTIVYVICCLFLGFVVLIQKGEGGGLGGAFGGGAVDKAFGAKADMTWKRATAVAATTFMILAIFLGIVQAQIQQRSVAAQEAAKKQQQADGDAAAQGEGDAAAQGEGDAAAQGEGDAAAQGEGDAAAQGDGSGGGAGDGSGGGGGNGSGGGAGDGSGGGAGQ